MPGPNPRYRRVRVYVVWFEREAIGIEHSAKNNSNGNNKSSTRITRFNGSNGQITGNDLFIPFPIRVNPRPKGRCNPCRVLLLLLPLEPNARAKGHSQAAEVLSSPGSRFTC
jgi:hypothetical protein